MKNFLSSSRIITTFLLLVVVLILFNFNFDRFKAGAQPIQVNGEGQLGYLAKWVDSPPPPVASALDVTVSNTRYCGEGIHATVAGTYSDSSGAFMTGYHVLINGGPDISTNPNVSMPNVEWDSDQVTLGVPIPSGGIFSTGNLPNNCSSSNGEQAVQVNCQMTWNTSYTAWAQVRSAFNIWSSWIQMSTFCNGTSCSGATSWTTPLHAFPNVGFTFTPLSPAVSQPVRFTDTTTFYGPVLPRTWAWNFGGGNPGTAPPPNPPQGPHDNTYGLAGTYIATLTASDDVGSCTSAPQIINVQKVIPRWKEVAPR